ncbi:MAG: hypothetical protein GY810_02600 [Aureispira sp.]|nr:hypothetical protein [Aureispira sp.]
MSDILDDDSIILAYKPLKLGHVIALHALQIVVIIVVVNVLNYLDTLPEVRRSNGWLGVIFGAVLLFTTALVIKYRVQTTWGKSILGTLSIFVVGVGAIALVGNLGLWPSVAAYGVANILIIELFAKIKTIQI